jgi:lysophospholipase L1-like esterase
MPSRPSARARRAPRIFKRQRALELYRRYAWRERQRQNAAQLAALLAIICLAMCVTVATGRHPRQAHAEPAPARPSLPVRPVADTHAATPDATPLAARPRADEPKWVQRHQRQVESARTQRPHVMLIGDSITQGWEFSPEWKSRFVPLGAVNAGIASDRVEHMLWRVQHGLLATARPDVVVLLGGVNNLAVAAPDRIAATMGQLIDEIHAKSPKTRILLLGVLPSGASPQHKRRAKIAAVNARLVRLGARPGVTWLDIGQTFLERDGSISKKIMFDELHLTKAGYARFAKAIDAPLTKLLKGTDVAGR